MRISICGPESQGAIAKAEKVLRVETKTAWEINGKSTIIDHAAETYKYFNESNVIFKGSAFDFLGKETSEGYEDVYEQIALNTLSNLDYVVVITMGMDSATRKIYEEYAKMFPGKFYIYGSDADFEIVMQ